MKKTLLTLLICAAAGSLQAQKLIPVAPGYAATSVNTTIFRNNSVVTNGKYQYVSFYDNEGYVTVGKRKLKSDRWDVKRTRYKGNVKDAHNVISMMVDGDGYIHMSFDHHGHPLRYCKSVAPGSLEFGDLISMTGNDETHVTYPEFYNLKNGDLIFVYRSGSSGNGNLVMNRYDVKSKSWSRVQDVLIDGEGKRNAYWQLCVDESGVMHLSWVWRETWMVETNHDLCYARSLDGGRTWEKSDGEKYSLPINAGNAEYACIIPQRSELINQTSMTTDKKGRPYIVTYWREQGSDVPQYRLVWNDGDAWHQQQISQRRTPFSLSGGGTKMIPIARPRLVIDEKGKKTRAYCIFRDEERDSRVSMAYSDDINAGAWEYSDLTDFSVEAWEPSLDTGLWMKKRKLHLFVQKSTQGDGEKATESGEEMVYVMEVK